MHSGGVLRAPLRHAFRVLAIIGTMDAEQLVRRSWRALAEGDETVLERIFAPGARWRAVEDGPWNCEGLGQIASAMKRGGGRAVQGAIEEVSELGAGRVLVGFRPARAEPGVWPLDHGVRYVVLTFGEGLITEMKGCATRRAALAYAA